MHFGTLANLMVFASFSIKVNEIGSTANSAVLWSVAQILRFSEADEMDECPEKITLNEKNIVSHSNTIDHLIIHIFV